MQVEGGREEEAVGDMRVCRIEGRIVEHLEIDRSMGRPGGVIEALVHREGDLGLTVPGDGQL